MGKHYEHITIEERCEIARLQASGYSVRQIAAGLDRSPSTVARELKREWFKNSRVSAQVCGPAIPCPALAGLSVGTGRGAAGEGALWAQARLVTGAGGGTDGYGVQAVQASLTRAYIGSYTGRWLARRTTAGATTCLELSRSVVGEATKVAVLLPSWLSDAPSPSARRVLLTAALLVTGRRT